VNAAPTRTLNPPQPRHRLLSLSSLCFKMDATASRVKQLLTPLRTSIIDKPPYVSGTLQLSASSFSLFYKTTEDDHACRFADH